MCATDYLIFISCVFQSKLSSALSSKKKGVSTLVAKWQQVRQNLMDSDDEK
jgi:hypothetical protein